MNNQKIFKIMEQLKDGVKWRHDLGIKYNFDCNLRDYQEYKGELTILIKKYQDHLDNIKLIEKYKIAGSLLAKNDIIADYLDFWRFLPSLVFQIYEFEDLNLEDANIEFEDIYDEGNLDIFDEWVKKRKNEDYSVFCGKDEIYDKLIVGDEEYASDYYYDNKLEIRDIQIIIKDSYKRYSKKHKEESERVLTSVLPKELFHYIINGY